jgi:hypothetical protein
VAVGDFCGIVDGDLFGDEKVEENAEKSVLICCWGLVGICG